MEISFETIADHTIPVNDFSLNARFIENLPVATQNQLKPLNVEASKFLHDFITISELHKDDPFKKDFFKTKSVIDIKDGNNDEIKTWLHKLGIPLNKEVFLSWDSTTTMIVSWELFVKYFDDFYYSASDDLTIFDQSLNWAVFFAHYELLYYGSN